MSHLNGLHGVNGRGCLSTSSKGIHWASGHGLRRLKSNEAPNIKIASHGYGYYPVMRSVSTDFYLERGGTFISLIDNAGTSYGVQHRDDHKAEAHSGVLVCRTLYVSCKSSRIFNRDAREVLKVGLDIPHFTNSAFCWY